MRRLNGCLPGGLQLVRAAEADLSEPPLMAVINAALYRAFPEGKRGGRHWKKESAACWSERRFR